MNEDQDKVAMYHYESRFRSSVMGGRGEGCRSAVRRAASRWSSSLVLKTKKRGNGDIGSCSSITSLTLFDEEGFGNGGAGCLRALRRRPHIILL